MRIYIDPAHTPHSPGAVYGGRKEYDDIFLFSRELEKSLSDSDTAAEMITCRKDYKRINKNDVLLIFHRGTSYKNAPKRGAGVTVKADSSCSIQYEAYRLLEAVTKASGLKYRGVHTAGKDFLYPSALSSPAERTFLFELGFIEDERDNMLFDSSLIKTARQLRNKLCEIYKEEKNEDSP